MKRTGTLCKVFVPNRSEIWATVAKNRIKGWHLMHEKRERTRLESPGNWEKSVTIKIFCLSRSVTSLVYSKVMFFLCLYPGLHSCFSADCACKRKWIGFWQVANGRRRSGDAFDSFKRARNVISHDTFKNYSKRVIWMPRCFWLYYR